MIIRQSEINERLYDNLRLTNDYTTVWDKRMIIRQSEINEWLYDSLRLTKDYTTIWD